jgi:hypothetical protein
VKRYEDTCEVGDPTQKDDEFECHPSLSGLCQDQDTVRVYFVHPLLYEGIGVDLPPNMTQSLTIETLCPLINDVKYPASCQHPLFVY